MGAPKLRVIPEKYMKLKQLPRYPENEIVGCRECTCLDASRGGCMCEGHNHAIVPEVGMGVVIPVGSDCCPGTIVRVSESKKQIWVDRDEYLCVDPDGCAFKETHDYLFFEPEQRSEGVSYTLRKNGRWIRMGDGLNGQGIGLGWRDAYRDPCF